MKKSQIDTIPASCLILAGGRGLRLSPEKPLFTINGRPIIERVITTVVPLFKEVLLITNTPERYDYLNLPCIADQRQGCGPLMGIYSGLRKMSQDTAFVCAADMPFLDTNLIRYQYAAMNSYDIVVPWPRGVPEFLHALYGKQCLPVIQENLERNVFKIELITHRLKTLRLNREWFKKNNLISRVERGFININTIEDYRRWINPEKDASPDDITHSKKNVSPTLIKKTSPPIAPEVMGQIRRTLIRQESKYHYSLPKESYASLWAHSSRVGRIAHSLAIAEKKEAIPSLLAGLFHDTGKFSDGKYHDDDIAEEAHAARFVEKILTDSPYEQWIPTVKQAILTMYLEENQTSAIGRIVYDADNLDKLGHMGVGQFFTKGVFRRRFLGEEMIIRAGIELTYAHHAPDTLKTATGRKRAHQRKTRTFRFFTELLEEWEQLGLGTFNIRKENIAGIDCILVVPEACFCGGQLAIDSDIEDALKCRSLIVTYTCPACSTQNEISFCLPNIKGLPRK